MSPLDYIALTPLPRLLATVDLAVPVETLEQAIFAWASRSGRAVRSSADLILLARAMAQETVQGTEDSALDLQIARDALEGLRKRPHDGFAGYVRAWRARLHLQRSIGQGDEGRLRALQDQLGGIVLDGRSAPYVLIIPQPDGRYVQMGWESILLLDRSPLGDQRKLARILASEEVSAAERTYLHTA